MIERSHSSAASTTGGPPARASAPFSPLTALIELSLRNRLVVLSIALIASAVGVASVFNLDVDAFPDVTPVQVQINAVAPALGAEEIERQIAYPVEQAMSGLTGLTSLRSVSKFGFAQISLTFRDGVNVYFARQLVDERLNGVELPAGVEKPTLGPVSTGLGEVFHYIVAVKGVDLSSASEAERVAQLTRLRTIHDRAIKPKLRTVPGVAEVNTWGGYEKQYHVRIDPNRLLQRGVTFGETVEAVERNNDSAGGGGIRQSNQFLLVQGLGRTVDLDQIRAIVVTARDGVPIRVRDVADVEVGHEIRRGAVTANARGEAVLGLCFMTMGENSRIVASALRKRLEEIRPTLPADVEVTVVYDRTELVDVVIDTVRRNLFEGGLLVVAVLFAFLGNLRAAFLVALAIPLSMLCAFSGMLQFGVAASLLSLGAIDFGLVVDSSVVMVENCVRRIARNDGRPHVEVVRDAAVEVRKPTLFGELIIAIVYVPILTLEGVEGKLFRPMALTVVFAILGSMILSMTLTPLLASLLLPRRMRASEPWPMRVALALYRPILDFSMQHRLAVAVFSLTLVGVALGMIAPRLGSEFVPKLSEGALALNIVRLAGTDLAESMTQNGVIERRIRDAFPDEVRYVWSRVGVAEVATDPMGIELTDMYVVLHPRRQWTQAKTQSEFTKKLSALLRPIPGVEISYQQPIELRMNEMDTGVRADLGLKIYGDDFAQLNKLAGQAEKILQAVPGAADVTVEQLTGQPVVQVQLRQDELARYGAPAKTVLDVVRAVGGLRVGEAVEGDLRVPLAVRLAEPHRQDVKRLGALLVNTPTGERLPLSRLAEVKLTEGPATIGREWGQRRITVSCNIRGRDLGGFVAEAKEKMASLRLPDERYHLAWGGQFEHYERARNRLAVVVPVAAGLIFMMLYFTYHNVIDALRVFVGVPFGLVGGVFALWLRDMPLSISAIVGFIALSGVAVLDDMILVSTVRQLRRRGMAVRDAVRAAALIRLRPVLMTTLVAALGFLPMALSDGQGAEVQRPLATVVIGGVVGALAMSLLALRVLYLAFDGLAHGLFWMLVRVFRWEEGSARAAVGLDVDVPPNDGGVREGGD